MCDQETPQSEKYPDIKDECYQQRATLLCVALAVKDLMKNPLFDPDGLQPDSSTDLGEMKANIMLAYRHIEDARMRLGKVVQAYDGGKSCYPK